MNEPLIEPVPRIHEAPETRALLERIGEDPASSCKILRTAGHSVAALACLVPQIEATAHMRLPARLRWAVGLRVAQLNGCAYCLAAQQAEGTDLGLAPEEVRRYRQGLSDDPKEQALLGLTTKIVLERGHHCGFAVATARKLGVSDEELVELIALIGLHTLRNYLTEVARTTFEHPSPEPPE